MFSTPPYLERGDRVHIVAPSGVFSRERFEAGVQILEDEGYEVVFSKKGLFSAARYLAGSDEHRLAALNDALADPLTKVIWTARGGYGATRLLPGLLPEQIQATKKWFVGFSDVTALHALWQRAGLVSLHGANVTPLGDWSKDARSELFACLKGDFSHSRYPVVSESDTSIEGRVMGGNLTVLAAMAGTQTLPSWKDAIVVLEDVGEKAYRLDRSLTQLVQAGAFTGARAVVIGELLDCPSPDPAWTSLDVVRDVLAPLNLPLATGLEVGHGNSSRALALGASAMLDGGKNELILGANAVEKAIRS